VPSGPADKHLHVIVLGPVTIDGYGNGDRLLMVGITSIYEGTPHDPACELSVGDHPFIKHPSYVAYRYIRIDPRAHVEQMVAARVCVPHSPFSQDVLKKIIAGVCISKMTPREFKRIFQCL
jgi:hypothetical protein